MSAKPKLMLIRNVVLFAYGLVHHPKAKGGKYLVDEAFADDMEHSFKVMTADGGWFPGVLIEHENNGTIHGRHLNVYKTDEGVSSDWEVPLAVANAIADGLFAYRSPTFIQELIHSHTGEKLRNALVETSFVSIPHLTNLPAFPKEFEGLEHSRSNLITHRSVPMTEATPTPEVPNAATPEDLEARIDAVEKRLDDLEGAMTDPDGNEPEGDSPVEQRLATLEAENTRLKHERAVIVEVPNATPAQVEELTLIRQSAPSVYESAVKHMKSKAPAPTAQEPIGNAGSGAPPVTMEQAEAEAVKHGHVLLSAQTEYITATHPHLVGEL